MCKVSRNSGSKLKVLRSSAGLGSGSVDSFLGLGGSSFFSGLLVSTFNVDFVVGFLGQCAVGPFLVSGFDAFFVFDAFFAAVGFV